MSAIHTGVRFDFLTDTYEFDFLFPFGGTAGGALGFLSEEVRLLGKIGRIRSLGSIDFDAVAGASFARFTGTPSWTLDISTLTGAMLIERYGARAPWGVFLSPPCKGSSRLLSAKKAATEKYQDMNRLSIAWTRAMLEAWGDDPPALILLENVPGLPTRAAAMLKELRAMLKRAGYVFHAEAHDCGEIGGLAQHRQRYLLVARLPRKCPALLYQPSKKRVRGVGEVLGELPMPATRDAARWGDLHVMPKLSWRNWLRLALIPAGGDWRDLEGVLQGRARREVFRRHPVQDWNEPSPTIIGKPQPSSGMAAVADPRVLAEVPVPTGFDAAYAVLGWSQASRTVAGNTSVGCGAYSVADGRERTLLVDVRVLMLDEAMALDLDPLKPPPFVPVIVAEDGTWHRPMTLLELARLQGYPAEMHGEPLRFDGTRTLIAEHIGNSVPVGAAAAIARQMLFTSMHAVMGSFALGAGAVWVDRPEAGRLHA